jgi:hypothetical protein
MILERTFSDEAAMTWHLYSPVESDQQFAGKRSLPVTETLVTDQALTGVRNKKRNLARDFRDFIDGRLANRGRAPDHRTAT